VRKKSICILTHMKSFVI